MNASRIQRVGVLLLGAFCASCDRPDPTEPVGEIAFAGSPGVKVSPPSDPQAVAVSHSQIDVTWQDNSSNETGFEVYRSTTGATGAFTALGGTDAGAVSYRDGTGTPSTTYCYQVRAFRTIGKNKSYSAFSTSDACATTQPPPLPAAPSGVNATPQFQGYRISVTWTDNSTNETGFRVERSATIAEPQWTTVGTTGPGVTSLNQDQAPVGDQPACYRLFAVNTFGDSEPSNIDCTAVPAAPTNLEATVLSDGTVKLTWTDISEIEEGYELVRGSSEGQSLTTLPADATSYLDAGLPDNSYSYMVHATKDGGTSSNSNFVQVVVATRAPDAPANVDALPASSSIINVSWIDVAVNEEGSRIERSTDGGTSWLAAGTIGWSLGAGWFSDEARSSEQEVCYRVIAFNHIGDSPASNMDCTTPPAAPSGFTATDAGSGVIDFAWSDNSTVEDGYQILIDYGYGYWEVIAGVSANATSFRLEGFQPYWGYEAYYVVATKEWGYSDWSNPASPVAAAASSVGR